MINFKYPLRIMTLHKQLLTVLKIMYNLMHHFDVIFISDVINFRQFDQKSQTLTHLYE